MDSCCKHYNNRSAVKEGWVSQLISLLPLPALFSTILFTVDHELSTCLVRSRHGALPTQIACCQLWADISRYFNMSSIYNLNQWREYSVNFQPYYQYCCVRIHGPTVDYPLTFQTFPKHLKMFLVSINQRLQ